MGHLEIKKTQRDPQPAPGLEVACSSASRSDVCWCDFQNMSILGEVTNDHPGKRTEATLATPMPAGLSNLSPFGIRLKNSQLVKLAFCLQGVVWFGFGLDRRNSRLYKR